MITDLGLTGLGFRWANLNPLFERASRAIKSPPTIFPAGEYKISKFKKNATELTNLSKEETL